MQENGEKVAIFSLEDARVASYSLEVRGKNICQTTGKSKTGGGNFARRVNAEHYKITFVLINNMFVLDEFFCFFFVGI